MNEQRQTQAPFVPAATQTVVLDNESIVDVRSAANFLGYLLRSTKRRRRLLLTTSTVTFALVVALALVMPRSYRIETRILTHKSSVMSALVHPGSSIPPSADNPTGGAVELIKSRNALSQLMDDIDLRTLWESKRSKPAKFKDNLLQKVFGKPSDEEIREAYLKMLDDKVTTHVEGDVLLINVEWADAEVAKKLADGVIARFLNMRRGMELAEIQETVKILGQTVESSRLGINDVVKRMQKIVEQRESDLEGHSASTRSEPRRKSRRSKFIAIRKPTGADALPGAEDARRVLSEKSAALTAAKRSYEGRLKRAQDELSSLLASLGPDHPDVMEAKRNLEAISREPAALSTLEAEQAAVQQQLRAQGLLTPDEPRAEAPAERKESDYDVMRVPVSEDLYKQMDKDPEIAAVLDDLKKRQDSHDELLSRLVNARLQSETSSVAFDYRYIITEPPVFPRKPIKPNVPVMVIGGAVGALFLGVLLSLLADLFSGRVLESWQVTRFLQMKALGELEEP